MAIRRAQSAQKTYEDFRISYSAMLLQLNAMLPCVSTAGPEPTEPTADPGDLFQQTCINDQTDTGEWLRGLAVRRRKKKAAEEAQRQAALERRLQRKGVEQ